MKSHFCPVCAMTFMLSERESTGRCGSVIRVGGDSYDDNGTPALNASLHWAARPDGGGVELPWDRVTACLLMKQMEKLWKSINSPYNGTNVLIYLRQHPKYKTNGESEKCVRIRDQRKKETEKSSRKAEDGKIKKEEKTEEDGQHGSCY